VPVSRREFDAMVERSLKSIPWRFRRRMENVIVVVSDEPPSPSLLGLYEGRPLPLRSVGDAFTMPDRITIFQGPHERMARNPAHLEELVAETVWHEVAHYFGMDEAQVRRAESRHRSLKRRPRRTPEP
jgi:predicted Zn-dependent protease with MMP-like domain